MKIYEDILSLDFFLCVFSNQVSVSDILYFLCFFHTVKFGFNVYLSFLIIVG